MQRVNVRACVRVLRACFLPLPHNPCVAQHVPELLHHPFVLRIVPKFANVQAGGSNGTAQLIVRFFEFLNAFFDGHETDVATAGKVLRF